MTTTDQMREAWASGLREEWRAQTVESVWLRPGDWYHPAVDALTEALSAGASPLGAAARLGAVRGAAGVGIAEALDDVAVLYHLLGSEPGLDVIRALCEGWAGAVEALPVHATFRDPESGLPTGEYLAVRLAETYAAPDRGTRPVSRSHCLVLVDVAAEDLPPWRRMARSAAMGRALSSALPGYPMAALGGGAFAVLTLRDATLGDTVRRVREQVSLHALEMEISELVRQPPRIWIEALPDQHDDAVELLGQLRR